MPFKLRYYLTALLLCAFTNAGYSQSIEAEQAKLAKLERQNENLSALNTDIRTSLDAINAEVSALESQQPPSTEVDKAASALNTAIAANDQQPSAINKDRLEMAQFKHALAVRKHSKANPALTSLKKERNELEKAIALNTQKIADNSDLIASQESLISKLQSQQKSAREAWLLKQEQQKTAAEKNRLQKAEQERQAALAEVERLRALLAQQQAQQEASKREQLRQTQVQEQVLTQAPATKTASAASKLEGFAYLANDNEIEAEKSRIQTALRAKGGDRNTTFNKFITIKTYENGALVDSQTKRLNNLGKSIYQNKRITIPVSDTMFVVGQSEWRVNLPELDQGVPVGEASSYIITLDLRNKALPFLTIYPD